eukprot:XP_015580192.1 uncharacterized protein LOC8265015 isoform X2 [Ricinus communis]
MIKRRFYRQEHGDKDEPSSSSSSSSDDDNISEAEGGATEESDDHAEVANVNENDDESSGYESEDSSAEEIGVDSSGFTNEDGSDKEIHIGSQLSNKHDALGKKELEPASMEDFVLRFKSVYKCRLCPRIVCLTEETMKTHLNSKRHVRSEKLLKENRLKAMLNSDGEIENQETPAEMHARVMALAQEGGDVSNTEKVKEPIKKQAKKRRKSDD